MKKILVTGPESSGKTTLAQGLNKHLDGLMVPEFSRIYLEKLNRPYIEDDLLAIAKGQLDWINRGVNKSPNFLILDTGLLVMKVWGLYKYQNSHPWIASNLEKQQFDFIFLSSPSDIPWEEDSLRENPNDRDILFQLYKEQLLALDWDFEILKGNEADRLDKALELIG
jgi:nicotinamide riboside kinase